MSEGVVEAVEKSFKELVIKKPYRSVTVKEICEGAFISRRTFYSNFIDKRAVIAYLFRRDAIEPVKRVLELLPADEARNIAPIVIARFYQGVHDNQEFYSALARPMRNVDATFVRVVCRAMESLLNDIVRRYGSPVDQQKHDFVVEYHASAQAMFLDRWIYEGYEMSPERLGEIQAPIIVPSIEMLVRESGELL